MGAPKVNLPKSEPPPDTTKAMIAALNFNETARKMRASSGRSSTFLTRGAPPAAGSPFQRPLNSALGQ